MEQDGEEVPAPSVSLKEETEGNIIILALLTFIVLVSQ